MSNVTVSLHPKAQRAADAKASALLQQLVNATPAQVQTWMQYNVLTITQAQNVLTALALAIRHLYLKE